ncbi:Gfo/Idh/MocA family protein [Kineococcus terrestris]|uniref:Gfo/Idh/MocA family protein n=1 Tax=Kineococcus terrestris TaxID=2044856 RepID=UPI0034DB02B9
MTHDVLRVGVVGAGVMGADHARTLHRSVSGAVVAAVADPDTARAAAAAADAGGARVSADPAEVCAADDVDAVVIASPDATHPALAAAALAAGKAVLCEKPLAPTLEGALEVAAAAAAPGAPLFAVGFMRRFDPGYAVLREAVREGRLGEPRLVHHVSRGVAPGPGATSESSVTGSAVHDLDVVPWLLGSAVVEVSWHAPAAALAGDPVLVDPQQLLLRTADGALTTVEVFLAARYGYDVRCEVVGSAGAAVLPVPARLQVDADLRRARAYDADWRPRFADAYRLELQAWVDAARGGPVDPALATAADGVAAQRVAAAAIASMRAGGAWREVGA